MDDRDIAIELMKTGDFAKARSLFDRLIEKDPNDWSTQYMVGQCCRFLNDMNSAIQHLEKAVILKIDDPSVFHALGIAYQLNNLFDKAIESFHSAIQLDQDYDLSYNSLALTHKKMDQFELSLHNYDAGAKALTRRIVKSMRNERSNRIYKHQDTPQNLWVEYALFGGMYLCSINDKIESIAWPTGEQAIREEKTEEHGGLYWHDTKDTIGKATRLFFPNFFNTFRQTLKKDRTYADLIGNRGTVLEMLGKTEEAVIHFKEAEFFSANVA